MQPVISIVRYSHDDEEKIMSLVRKVFDEFCATDCDGFGLKVFYDFIEVYNFVERNAANSITFIARTEDEIAGMIEMRDYNHICLLFVDKKYMGRGIASQLFNVAREIAISQNSKRIDVNASLFSVRIYEKLGFKKTDEMQEFNGIKYVPMICEFQ